MRPDVSVIIPMFNAGATVAEALESACAQRGPEIEVIVIDDGSTDHAATVVAQFAQRDSRVRLVSQSNQGLAGARNTGIAAARGEFLHFLDADDWLAPDGLSDLLTVARGSEAGAAYGDWRWSARSRANVRWTLALAAVAVAGASFEAAWGVGYRRTPLEARLGLPDTAPTAVDVSLAMERLIAIAAAAAPSDPSTLDLGAPWPVASWAPAAACVAAACPPGPPPMITNFKAMAGGYRSHAGPQR